MSKPADLTGQRFGRLVVVGLVDCSNTGRIWEVLCDCGEIRRVRTGKLRSGEHKSCGCLRGERMKERHRNCRVLVKDGKRPCAKCKQVLPVEDFHKSKKTLSGLQTRCKRCAMSYDWEKKFGVPRSEVDRILASQAGVCGACGLTKGLHLDHDHKTNKIRGFLCGNCNRALGLLRDSPKIIEALGRYLQNPPAERCTS